MIEREVALIAGLTDEREGVGEMGWNKNVRIIAKNMKMAREKNLRKKGPLLWMKILGNHKILGKYSWNRTEVSDFRENLRENGDLRKKSIKLTLFAETKFYEISYIRENAIKQFRFNQDRRSTDSSDSKSVVPWYLKNGLAFPHLAQYVEYNNNIAADFHIVSCIIDFIWNSKVCESRLHAFSRSMLCKEVHVVQYLSCRPWWRHAQVRFLPGRWGA
jgi:hypothetical protein